MRFLRALLNSGVFMIILLAAATLYLVYSDTIKRDHGLDAVNESSPAVAEMPAVVSSPVAVQTPLAAAPEPQVVSETVVAATPAVIAQEPIQVEPAFETQPPAYSQSDMPPMMPYQGMMPMPEPQMPPPMVAHQAPMNLPQMPSMPPMMPYQAPMDVPATVAPMQQSETMPQPVYQPAQMMPAQTNLEIARTALYEGNLDVAKQAYQAELTRTNDPDLHGELGNVYFAQQNWQDAAIEYAAAVEGLSAQGRFLQAQYVLGFLMQINPDMGQKAMMNLRATMYPQNN